MKSQISPVAAIVIILVVLAGVGLFLWKSVGGPNQGSGKMQSNLDTSKMETDPDKLQAKIREDLQRQEASKGK